MMKSFFVKQHFDKKLFAITQYFIPTTQLKIPPQCLSVQ